MSYDGIGFVNNNPPAINAENLNKMDNELVLLDGNVHTLQNVSENQIPLKLVANSYVTQAGVIVDYVGRSRTEYIYIGDYSVLYLSTIVSSEWNVFYTENKSAIMNFKVDSNSKIAVPKNAKYMILSNTNAGMENLTGHFDTRADNRFSYTEDRIENVESVVAISDDYIPGNSVLRHNTNCYLKIDGTLESGRSSDAYVSDFISIDGLTIKSISTAWENNVNFAAIAFYSDAAENSFLCSYMSPDVSPNAYWRGTTTFPEIPDGAKYIRIAGRTGIISGTPTITFNRIQSQSIHLQEEIDDINEQTAEFSVGKNLIDMDANVFYPVHIENGDILTISGENGAISTANDYIEFYGKDKNQRITFLTFTKDLSERTWPYNGASTAYYVKWGSMPKDYRVQLEFGSSKTAFEEYFGNSKLNYEQSVKKVDFNALVDDYKEFNHGKNMVDTKLDVFYPVHIENGDVITLSTSNGQNSTANDYIEFFGKDKGERIAYVTMSSGLSQRTWPYNGASTAYYAKWHSIPSAYKIQIEFGSSKTAFEEYFGNSKINYSLIQDSLPKNDIFTRCKEQILNIRNASGYNRGEYGKHDFNMLLMSDLHDDLVRATNGYTLTEVDSMIDAVANLGDYFGYSPNLQFAQQHYDLINITNKPAFTVLGNHDQRVDNQINITTKEVVDAVLRNTDTGEIYEDNGYGYYDFDDYNIRIIVLNCFDMPDIIENGSYVYYGSIPMYQQNQISWLINVLNSVPEDYSVVVLSHYSEPATIDNSIINTHPEFIGASYDENTSWGSIGRMSGTVISDIIDAYMNRTTLTETYTYSMDGSHPGTVSVSADFSDAKGEFVCYLVGHMHCNAIGRITNHSDQIVYFHDSSRATINNSSWTTISSMYSRDTETQNQDLLTVFSIDTVNKFLKFVRIGAHINVFGEDYNIVVYPYHNQEE